MARTSRYALVRNLYEILSEHDKSYSLRRPVFWQREDGYSLLGTTGTEISKRARNRLELGVVCEMVYVMEGGGEKSY